MKKLLLMLVLSVEVSALAQGPVPLEEGVRDFPRSLLQIENDGPVSLDGDGGTRAAYEALADRAGLNLVLDPDVQDSSSLPFRIETPNVLQAFDLLSERTGNFVEVLNPRTIIAAPDNLDKRRDYELQVIKAFYLPATTNLSDVLMTLRTTLRSRFLAQSSVANAIVLRDTPNRVALAEQIIGQSAQAIANAAAAARGESFTGGGPIFTLEAGAIGVSTPARAALEPSSRGVVSFDLNETDRATFEVLARAAGLNIVFDSDFGGQDVRPFRVDNVDVLDALDLLAVQSRTLWEVLGSNTILVAPDTVEKQLALENALIKTFYLPGATQVELVEIVTALRSQLNCRFVSILGSANAIVIRDNPKRMAFAERIIADLHRAGPVAASAEMSSGSLAGQTLQVRAARALASWPNGFEPTVRGPLSVDINTGVRESYEAVAGLARLHVVFDDQVQHGVAGAYRLQGVDILDALDFLSLQTRNVWRVIDSDTILVAPDNDAIREGFLPRTTATIDLTGVGEEGATEIVTALRTLLGLRQVETLNNSIVIADTSGNVAFAERLVSDWTLALSR